MKCTLAQILKFIKFLNTTGYKTDKQLGKEILNFEKKGQGLGSSQQRTEGRDLVALQLHTC